MYGNKSDHGPASGIAHTSENQMAYSAKSAARVLDLSERKVWQLIGDGEIKTFLIGRSRRISRQALEAFIDSKATAA